MSILPSHTRASHRGLVIMDGQVRASEQFLVKPVHVMDLDGLWPEEAVKRNEEVAR